MTEDDVIALYGRYAEDLLRVREEQRSLYEHNGYSRLQPFFPYRAVRFASRRVGVDWERRRFMNPQLDDVEAELTYLRIRDLRPDVVVEMGSFRGWSTTWILQALRDNGRGSLLSFDLIDDAEYFIPADLRRRWRLVVGDVQGQLALMPQVIDYIFVDADHGASFAIWCLSEVMPRVVFGGSVHDVFHDPDPDRGSGEAKVVLDWLRREGIEWSTASRLASPERAARVAAVRQSVGLGGPIHYGDHDSAVFFTFDQT